MSQKPTPEQRRLYLMRRVAPHYADAVKLMVEWYNKSDRPKLSHFWVQQQLNIPQYVAFSLLETLANSQVYCAQLSDGRIFWLNELEPVFSESNLGQLAVK
jgi:hypothetical protein